MWTWLQGQSNHNVLFGVQNTKAREQCIKHKLDIYGNSKTEDVKIFEHFVTVTNGVILWFRAEKPLAPEIRCKEFQVRTFIPDIVRPREQYPDMLFMEYNDVGNSNFRDII